MFKCDKILIRGIIMKHKNKLVAIVSNLDGGSQYVALVKNVYESEYATLLHEQRQHELKENETKKILLESIEELTTKINDLEQEIKVLKGEE